MLSTGRGFQRWMGPLLAVVGAFVVVDGGLLVYSLGASARVPQQQELAAESTRISLLRADVARARAIQRDMPKTKADCERFETSLPPARGGYSAITTELGELGRTAGLQISSLDFHSTPITARGLTEVAVDAKVTGDYKSVVKFLNGVQRSANYYIIESLSLAPAGPSGPSGAVSVDVHLLSYFKGAA
jgi:type IV pilus assembly protein PilO